MKYINVISKQNHNVIESKLDDNIIVKENSVVLIDANLEDVQKIERQGNDLIIHFKNGEILKISDFYNENNTADNSLVFKDDEAKLSWIQHLEDTQIIDKSIYYQSIDELEPLLYEHDAGFLIGTPWLFAGGVLAAGGLIAGLSSSNSKHETSTEDNTIAQPVAPTKYINDISGETIYLSIEKISNDDTPSFVIQNLANGQTALLYVDGVKVDAIYDKASNTLTPKIPLAEGTHEISYIIVNQQGNVSSPSDKVVITIDVTAPIEPIITTNNASGLSGSSEANALITLDLGNGTTLTTTTNSQGKWSFAPNPIADGETATLMATDAAGNIGPSITTDKADTIVPLAPSVEQNNAASLSGSSEANALITLDLGHGHTLTTTANSQGKWSFTPNPIADGETATLTATDTAGNVGAETITDKADTIAPLAPSVEQNNAANLSGTSEANALITLDLGNGNTLTTTANSQGKWSFVPNPITDGETGKLTATDAAGNVGAETTTDKADTIAPLAPSVELNNAITLSGTSEANALITLDLGNGTTLTTTANSQGKWSFAPNPITDGETGKLTATDAAGNVGSSITTDKADTVAPLAPSVEQNNASGLGGTSEANALITLDLGNGTTLTTTANSQGKWSFVPNPIADGETGKLTATDAAGNVGAETTTDKTDTVAPLAPSVELNNAASLLGTSEANALITLDLGNGTTLTTTANSQGKWSFEPNPIADGETATLTATDTAGNVGAETITDKADTVAPLAPSVDLNNAITLSGTSEANVVITLDLGHGNTLTTTANSQGKWSFAPNPIVDGETGKLTATDTAGNIGPSITTDKADTIAPLAPSVDQNNASGLSGTAEANALITLDLGNGNTLTTTANSQGKWSFVPNPIADGETGKLTATDTAGNIGLSITTDKADTVAPLAPSVEQNNASGLSGTSEAIVLITLDLGHGNTLTTTANSQGKWLFAPNPIADGETGKLTATDAAGNVGAETTTDKTDTVAPLAPSVELNNAASLSGTSEANALITLDLGHGNTLTTTANSQGKWSFEPNPIADGETATLTATDTAGNVGAETITDKADTVAPLAPSVELNNAASLLGTSEANALITLDLGNGTTLTTTANSQGKWSFEPNPIADGETATLTATDTAGNVGAETITDKADTVAPLAPSVDLNNAIILSGTSEANVVITLDLGHGNTLTTTANSQGKWSFAPNPIVDGETGKLTATDTAGNIGPSITTDKADTIAPLAPSVDQNNASGLSGTAEANALITLDLGNGNTLTTTANSQGKWSFVPNPIADGETGKLTATDTAGNIGLSITTDKADTVAPLAPSVEQNNASGLSGTSEAIALITLDLGHGNTLTTTANSQGKWLFAPNPIADGETGKLTATDAAGNVGAETTTDKTDTVAPLAPSVELNNAASLSGTSEANALITLDLGHGNTLTTTANSQGKWSFEPNPIADGETATLTATDTAGNVGAETITDKADTVAPLAPSVDLNNAITLSGTSEANAVITLDLGHGNTLTTTANSQGKWSFAPNPIADGETGKLTATDTAGNIGPSVTTDKADTVAPLAPSVEQNNAVSLSGTSEANAVITLDLGNGTTLTTTANSQGKWSFVPNPIADGETGKLTATDAAGNVGAETTTDKTDTVAPLAPSVDQNNASELSGSSEANALITLDLGHGTTLTTTANSQGKWLFAPNPIADGETATLTATDAAGNIGAETTTAKADKVAPLAPSVEQNNAASLSGTSEANAVITLDLGHGNTLTTTANSQGKWSFVPNPLADGETGKLTATDAAGNTGAETTTEKADTVAPLAPSVEQNNAANLSGTSEANALITLDLGNGTTLTTTANSQGKWSFVPNPIADGETGKLTATDAAGNVGAETTTDKTDTVAPLAPSVDQNNASELSGSSEANALITLDLGHGTTLTTTANSQGKWLFAPNPIADGETATLTATDAAGNIGAETTTAKADKVAPLAPSVEQNNAASLSGTSEANAVITLDLGHGNTLTTTANSQGKWSFVPNPLADGETGKLTATDAAGNTGAETTTEKADTVAPLAPSVEQNNAANLSGTSEANALITLDLGNGNTLTTTANSQGKWSFAPNPIVDGETGKLTATDAAGNVGLSITTDKADTIAPLAPSVEQNNAANLSGTSEANALITLDLGHGHTLTTTANSQGKWSFAPNPIADGETATLTAKDTAGNIGPSITTDKADTVAPLAPSVEQNNASGLGGTSEANALITLDLGNGNTLTTTANSQGKWSFAPNPIADGETGKLTATDAAGNIGSSITTDKADTVAPLAPSVELNNALGLSGSSEANAVITLDLGNGHTLTTTANSQGKWSFAPNPLADGETATLTATDAAGNIGPSIHTEKADTVAPLAPSVDQNNAAGLVGTSEANAVITLDLGNGNTLTTTASNQGKWSFVPNPIADGETATLTATDAAGNVGASITTEKADTVTPLAPSVDQNNGAGLVGTSEANAVITLDLGNGHTLTTTANSQGKWSFVPNPIADGETATLTATDAAGNIGAETTTAKADTVAPLAPSVEQNNAASLSGTSEANAVITLDLGNGTTLTTTANSQGKWSFAPNPIADGETGKLTATDAAGNVGSSITTDKADTVAPLAPSVEQNNASGLGGTSEANALITLDLGNGTTLTTTANNQGKWSFVPNPIADGETGKLTATDAAGNVGSSITTDKADTVAPLAPSVEQNNAASLSGTSEVNAVITLDLGHGKTLTTTADSQGKWSFAPNPIADGETATLTATDVAGNVGAETTTDQADTVAPLAPSVEQNNAASLLGTSEANVLITLDLGHGTTLTTTANSQGKWSFVPNPIANGETGTLTATDAAGNVGAETITDKADTVAPLAPSVELNNASELSGSSEANAVITLDLGNGNTLTTTANSQGKWSFAPNPISDGEIGKLTATDAAGNVGAETTTDKADTVAPLAPSVEQNNASGLGGTSEANAVITLDLGNGHTLTTTADSQGKWSFAPNPIENDETASLTATDAAGNIGAETITEKADTVAPLAPVVDLNNAASLSGTSEANTLITLDLGNGNTLTTTADENGLWSFKPNPLADGTSGAVTAMDAAGNESSVKLTGVADTVAPTAPIIKNNSIAELAGRAEPDSVVTVKDIHGNTVTTITDSTGKWSVTMPGLSEGDRLSVTATDVAGNVSEPTLVNVVTVSEVYATIDSYTDNVGAFVGDFLSGTSTDDTSPVLNGTLSALLENGQVLRIYAGTTLMGTATIDGKNWSCALSNLADATYTFTAVIESDTGILGTPSDPFTLIVDTVSPTTTTTIAFHDDVGAVQGDFTGTGTVTDDRQIQLSGKLSDTLFVDEKVLIYNGTTLLGFAKVSGTEWTFDVTDLLKNGVNYTFTAVVADTTGNTASKASVNLTVALNVGIQGQTTADTTPLLTGTINFDMLTATEHLNVIVNGVTYSSLTGAVVLDLANHKWYVQIPDANILTAKTYTVTAQVVKTADGSVVSSLANAPLIIQTTADVAPTTSSWATTANPGSSTNNTISYALNTDGLWTIVANHQVYNSTSISNYTHYATLTTSHGTTVSVAGLDFNRSGLLSIASTDTSYSNSTQSFYTNTGSGYALSQLNMGTTIYYGGVVVYDKTGDGYLDLVYGDGGNDSVTFIANTNGVLGLDGANGHAGMPDYDTGRELSGVDINNDGAVDIVQHAEHAGAYGLTVIKNNGTSLSVGQSIANVFENYNANSTSSASLTWADFNGDGYMDLYLSTGYNNNVGGIYYNNAGKLSSTISAVGSTASAGYLSVALDWNHDGMMDLVKFTTYGTAQTATLFTNLNSGTNWNTGLLRSGLVNVTGIAALDYDWDGAVDLMVSQANGSIALIHNEQAIAKGTAMHLRIVDSEGINVYYGNTVQLYDSKGRLVASQIINPQSGIGSNDASAIVNFYGLDPNETYSATIVKMNKGVSNNVTWTGLVAGDGTESYALTAVAATGIHSGTLTGTGYNDTFIADTGTYVYNGSGGWSKVSGFGVWSATGGIDIVDYRNSSSGITIDLSKTGYQITGYNFAKFINIEGIAGTSSNDVFTNNAADNYFEGRGGNDIFNLINHGGHDTLIYKLINATDATGGNGVDTVNGFFVGTFETAPDADRIDIQGLLNGYTASGTDGYSAKYINGVATINAGDNISKYLNVYFDGTNTHMQIDRNGAGEYTDLLVMNNVQTDLATLLANHQIIIA